ncbi:phosphatase PAP2 family protein [Mesorhizobium sp. PAMC28654]|uniref:phosphatase PAP2 family protein n=1 Tax=Mesorhizobium sp. PAMC28654 TaxID=2880934 RepID=UPI001D0A5BCD|nr:phosphatase PAP2 family protein [Mesorhizobium sp. PAMC28654]UDL88616.1 phosphatase PAP2 family protein [Mesorhizobium sp. PAMC28654]
MLAMSAALEVVGFGILITVPLLVLSYIVISFDFPLADGKLASMDSALGFDWHGFIRFVDARPLLSRVLLEAYQTISYQLILIPMALVVFGRQQRAYAMMTGYCMLCVLACFISMFFPALGTYAYYGLTYQSVNNINPYFALSPVESFNAVRDNYAYTLTASSAAGLICFPSIHAGVAYLCTWAAWDVKALRYPVLVLNIVMSVAAVSHANHYLVDIISGFGTSAFVTVVVTALFYRNSRWRSMLSHQIHALISGARSKA